MIIWQGFGFLAFLIPIICSAIVAIPFGENKIMSLGWIIGGLILYFLGKQLHDPKTNEKFLYDENGNGCRYKIHTDTLFWIPMEYCGILWIIGAIIYLFS